MIPALAAASHPVPVQTFLAKPRQGNARLTFVTDGSSADGQILRVTDQFIVFQIGRSCSIIPLSEIGSVEWKGRPRTKRQWDPLLFLFSLPAPELLFPHDILYWDWKTIPSPHGPVSLIRFRSGRIIRTDTTVSYGRYRVETGRLYLTYESRQEDGEQEQSFATHFDCQGLLLESEKGMTRLKRDSQSQTSLTPIVGGWQDRSNAWEFHPDGTFEIRKTSGRTGTFVRNGKNMTVHWDSGTGPPDEQWEFRTAKHRHLLITVNSVTTEYQHDLSAFYEFP